MVASPHSTHYWRSGSWQVATVLNPSLQNSLPESRERGNGAADDQTGSKPEGSKPQSPLTAYKLWQEEDEDEKERGHKLTLPPQYVRPSELCKAMPKYTKLKGLPIPFSASTAEPVNPCSPPGSSPRASDSSGRETPRSVPDTPHITAKSSRQPSPVSNYGYRLQTPALSASSALREQEGPPSPRSRSAATSPTLPIVGGSKHATLLRSRLSTLAQGGELTPRMTQLKSTAQGSPLSPAHSALESSRLGRRLPTPPVASPARRARSPHPPAPTLESYEKASPNAPATNAVWNDRRDSAGSCKLTHPRHSILRKSA